VDWAPKGVGVGATELGRQEEGRWRYGRAINHYGRLAFQRNTGVKRCNPAQLHYATTNSPPLCTTPATDLCCRSLTPLLPQPPSAATPTISQDANCQRTVNWVDFTGGTDVHTRCNQPLLPQPSTFTPHKLSEPLIHRFNVINLATGVNF
jgi:hypothetical protein